MLCPKCGREIKKEYFPAGLAFCPYCGERLNAPEGLGPLTFCPYCGQKLPTRAIFCPQCGRKIIPEGEKPVEAEKIAQPEKPREDIQLIMAEKVSEPVATGKLSKTMMSIWAQVETGLAKAMEPVRDFISGQWRLKRLYQHWAQYDALPSEEIPSSETLTHISKEAGGQVYMPLRILLIILGLLVLVAFFIFIGILINQCG